MNSLVVWMPVIIVALITFGIGLVLVVFDFLHNQKNNIYQGQAHSKMIWVGAALYPTLITLLFSGVYFSIINVISYLLKG